MGKNRLYTRDLRRSFIVYKLDYFTGVFDWYVTVTLYSMKIQERVLHKWNVLGILEVVLLKQLNSIRYISNWKRPRIRVIKNLLVWSLWKYVSKYSGRNRRRLRPCAVERVGEREDVCGFGTDGTIDGFKNVVDKKNVFKLKQDIWTKGYSNKNKIYLENVMCGWKGNNFFFYISFLKYNKTYTVSCYGKNVNIDSLELVKFCFRVIFSHVSFVNAYRSHAFRVVCNVTDGGSWSTSFSITFYYFPEPAFAGSYSSRRQRTRHTFRPNILCFIVSNLYRHYRLICNCLAFSSFSQIPLVTRTRVAAHIHLVMLRAGFMCRLYGHASHAWNL